MCRSRRSTARRVRSCISDPHLGRDAPSRGGPSACRRSPPRGSRCNLLLADTRYRLRRPQGSRRGAGRYFSPWPPGRRSRDGSLGIHGNKGTRDSQSSTYWLRSRRVTGGTYRRPHGDDRCAVAQHTEAIERDGGRRSGWRVRNVLQLDMADGGLPSYRTVATRGLSVMTAIVAWLIGGNWLWDRPIRQEAPGPTLVYNVATVATLFLSIFALFAISVVLVLVGNLVIINPTFRAKNFGEQARMHELHGASDDSAQRSVSRQGPRSELGLRHRPSTAHARRARTSTTTRRRHGPRGRPQQE